MRGIAEVLDSLVASWSSSVRFWDPRSPGPIHGNAIGFPGGVRDVIVADTDYTVLCCDGSVQRRVRPDLAPATEHPERACLEIVNSTIHIGLGENLLRIPPGGPPELIGGGPFVQAAPLNGNAVAVIDHGGRIRYLPPQAPPDDTPEAVDLIAANRVDRVVTATGDVLNEWEMNTAGNLDVFNQDMARVTTRRAPARVTSLAMSPLSGLITAGLANGDVTVLESPSLWANRTLSGEGTPITAVAQLRDETVVTGSAAGIVQCWPADSAHGPVAFSRRSGAITAMAVAEPWWLITADEDGAIVLWPTLLPRPVHELNLGAPIVALAADGNLVAARDANGRLWTFDLDSPRGRPLEFQLTAQVRDTEVSSTLLVELTDPSTESYELTAIRVLVDGEPPRVTVQEPWPCLEPDGTFTVPTRPFAGQPLILICTWPYPVRSDRIRIEVDVASRLQPRYRAIYVL